MNPIKTVIHKIFRHNVAPIEEPHASKWLRRATSVASPRRRCSQRRSKSLRSMKSAVAPRIPSLRYDDFSTSFDTLFTPPLTSSRSADTRSPSTPSTPWSPWSGTRSPSISSAMIKNLILPYPGPSLISESEVYLSPISLWEEDDVIYDASDEEKRSRREDPTRFDMNSLFWRTIVHDMLRNPASVSVPKDDVPFIHS